MTYITGGKDLLTLKSMMKVVKTTVKHRRFKKREMLTGIPEALVKNMKKEII